MYDTKIWQYQQTAREIRDHLSTGDSPSQNYINVSKKLKKIITIVGGVLKKKAKLLKLFNSTQNH